MCVLLCLGSEVVNDCSRAREAGDFWPAHLKSVAG